MPQARGVVELIGISEGEDRCVNAFALCGFGKEVHAIVVQLDKIGKEMVVPRIVCSDVLQGILYNCLELLLEKLSTEDISCFGVYASKALIYL